MIGARTAAPGFVLSTTTERPDARDAAISCPGALRLPGVPKQVLADVIVRAGEPLAEERGLAGGRQPDQDHALHRSNRYLSMRFDDWVAALEQRHLADFRRR